jgi:hypothetical protein
MKHATISGTIGLTLAVIVALYFGYDSMWPKLLPSPPAQAQVQMSPDIRFVCSHTHKETIVILTGAGGFPANIDVCDEWRVK